jgi:hypothetical protein
MPCELIKKLEGALNKTLQQRLLFILDIKVS